MDAVDRQIPAETSKMNSGGEELRDHDFPVPPPNSGQAAPQPVAQPSSTPEPQPEEIRSGGEHGTVPGDRSSKGENPVVMDQDMSTPDFAQEL